MSKRLDQLERENQDMRRQIQALTAAQAPAPVQTLPAAEDKAAAPAAVAQTAPTATDQGGFVGVNNAYGYAILDPTTAGKSKPLTLLRAKGDGQLGLGKVYLSGAVTAIADYQHTSHPGKMAYLMRQPGNAPGKDASEAALHTVQLALTANLNRWVSAYAEMQYDPEQSFGSGTITDLSRNELSVRKAFVLVGDLSAAPVYAMLGKIESPFGQTDSVSPFTLSTDWHAFAGLSYGALIGYSKGGLNLEAEAVQGGAEFRGLNMPVEKTATPSHLNNYVFDASYRLSLGAPGRWVMAGGSYEGGSSYCQAFPIEHFGACDRPNPAWAAYGGLRWDGFTLRGEYMKTVHVWPGTFNPNPPLDIWRASNVTTYDVGAQYKFAAFGQPVALSLDWSELLAGQEHSPWRGQNQFVSGFAYYLQPNVKLFSEALFIHGYTPLQFLSGGVTGLPPTFLLSTTSASSQIFIAGVNAAF